MSLLTIAQNAAREVGVISPSTVVNNSEDTAQRLLAMARREGRVLSRRRPWQVLVKTELFDTVAGQGAYDLPGDLRSIIRMTWWDRNDNTLLQGPASPQVWSRLKSDDISNTADSWFRIQGNKFNLHPVPSSAETIAFEYVSDAWVDTTGDGLGDATDWQADGDVAVLNEDVVTMGVVWRMLNALGLPYQEQFNEYQREAERLAARDTSSSSVSLNRSTGFPLGPLFGQKITVTGA